MNDIIEGLVDVSDDTVVPYRFENGKITLFFGLSGCKVNENLSELIGNILGKNEKILYKLTFPLKTFIDYADFGGNKQLYGTITLDVDFYIIKYNEKLTYNRMKFSFKELDYFIPSGHMFSLTTDGNAGHVALIPREIARFDFTYSGKNVAFVLQARSEFTIGSQGAASSLSELILEFEDTDNLKFITELYHLIRNLFSFICNRKNLSFSMATLIGKCIKKFPKKTNEEGKMVIENKEVTVEQILNVIDNFADDWETDKSINKDINYGYLCENFSSLLNLMAEDKITVSSIHSCNKVKNLIDLNQSLHITATFEFYQRTYLPSISSTETNEVYDDIKALIQTYIETQTDKKKIKKAKQIIKSLDPNISLKDKIVKVYNGYSTWSGVQAILDEWFEDRVNDLAQVANDWRNELAHEKNEYQPDRRVVDAVRLVEHLNYCIVLRLAGYTDSQIKNFIEIVLTR